MSSPTTYDQSLLIGTAVPNPDEKQAGYNADILLNKASAPNTNAGQPQTTAEPLAAVEAQHTKPLRPSFWKSARGKLLIGLVVVLVLAAAIGGGVGGALGKKSKSTTTGQGLTGSDGSDTNQGTSPQSNSDGSGQS
ncbi:hypothetical protein M407DRAFT_245262 [Tulasnella calospora MUT 4182]|uniref:Uncharacterized protein n=1 Tax=Tulasnella calospora MUT 4182 TaxID=1051891 RepID=A0A0C3KL02_9AGAM|nr:hypothetical protein M407DRAFT_245262 [Tulasnella calospora MUT 4182]